MPGLDVILDGGLTADRLYLLEGVPGSGKTTMAMQFLREGAARGETVLYVTLSETEQELREVAASHGWTLDGIHVHELFPLGDQLDPDDQYTMFHPSEVELTDTTRRILEEVERLQPTRVVFDSLAEVRLLSGTILRLRRQVLALKQYFSGRGSTVLLLDESQVAEQGLHVHTVVHGVIELHQLRPEFGGDRRRLRVNKMRGRPFRGGNHDYVIETGGVRVFPRLIAAASSARRPHDPGQQRSAGDGPAARWRPGARHQHAADRRGRHRQVVAGDPLRDGRGGARRALGDVPVRRERAHPQHPVARHRLRPGRPHRRGHGRGADRSIRVNCRRANSSMASARRSRSQGARVVVIDSLNGYLNSMPEEHHVLVQLHELLAYLAQLDVVTLLINAQQGLIGQMANTAGRRATSPTPWCCCATSRPAARCARRCRC